MTIHLESTDTATSAVSMCIHTRYGDTRIPEHPFLFDLKEMGIWQGYWTDTDVIWRGGRWEWWLLAVEEDPDGEEEGNVVDDEDEALERCGLWPPGRKTIQAERKMATEAADEQGCTEGGVVVSSPVLQFSGGWRKGRKSMEMGMAGRAD